MKKVLPEFTNNPVAESDTIFSEKDGKKNVDFIVYPAKNGEELVGTAVEAKSMGFGGELKVLVGFNAEGKIYNYSLLAHTETPGLGSKAADWFKKGGKGDITGMNPGQKALTVSKDGGQVDAITASTITSRAFLQAVNNAYAAYSGQQVDGASGATQQVSATVEKDTTACSGTLCKEGQTCDAKCDSCKVACGEKCDSVDCKKANCANVDCKKAECPNKDCKNKK